jgi:hypothetical protein
MGIILDEYDHLTIKLEKRILTNCVNNKNVKSTLAYYFIWFMNYIALILYCYRTPVANASILLVKMNSDTKFPLIYT